MFAKVESGSVKELLKGNKGFVANNNQYPASVFTLWTEAERNAIGIYTIEIDNTNLKNTEWYINTDITYAYDSSANKVKGTYGTATAKAHADILYTEQDKTDGEIPADKDVGDVATDGLKTVLIRQVKQQAENILNKTDWYITRKAEKSTAIPSAITTHRDAVRTKQAEMETAITNAADTPALETLYTYTTKDGVTSRPLGELPTLE
tara:strand:+ start:209 stop:829 length:621 start_codon:yes stop_codon:yes gene_type:complete